MQFSPININVLQYVNMKTMNESIKLKTMIAKSINPEINIFPLIIMLINISHKYESNPTGIIHKSLIRCSL